MSVRQTGHKLLPLEFLSKSKTTSPILISAWQFRLDNIGIQLLFTVSSSLRRHNHGPIISASSDHFSSLVSQWLGWHLIINMALTSFLRKYPWRKNLHIPVLLILELIVIRFIVLSLLKPYTWAKKQPCLLWEFLVFSKTNKYLSVCMPGTSGLTNL